MKKSQTVISSIDCQKTLRQPVKTIGIGLFTGVEVECVLHPAPVNHGIVFQRVDLDKKPTIAASITNAIAGERYTKLRNEFGEIATIEHLLSALAGLGIDNALITINGPELPIHDGSAKEFVSLIQKAGIEKQKEKKSIYKITEPIFLSHEHSLLMALPSDEFKVSCTLSYPQSEILRAQYHSLVITPESYEKEIASARTFSLYEHLIPLWNLGYLKHAGLNNGVVIKDNIILNPEGLRYDNEMVRHKILDLIGDLFLLAHSIKGHFVAIRSGHAMNIAFAQNIIKSMQQEVSYAS